jgi:hypothetical protein
MTLGFRLSRRLIAAVALQDESVTHHDSRYVARRRDQAEARMSRYLERLVEQLRPDRLCVYAPTSPTALTELLVQRVGELAARHGIPVVHIDRRTLRGAIGLEPDATRRALLEGVVALWPTCATLPAATQTAFAEAALAAMTGDVLAALSA